MNWQPMNNAPKGGFETVTKKVNGASVTSRAFVPAMLYTASQCGKVIVSHWMPDQDRWHMYSKGETPIGWMLFLEDLPAPKHPYELEAA